MPLTLAETVASLWPALQELARCGNLACRSDLQVGGCLGDPRSAAEQEAAVGAQWLESTVLCWLSQAGRSHFTGSSRGFGLFQQGRGIHCLLRSHPRSHHRQAETQMCLQSPS